MANLRRRFLARSLACLFTGLSVGAKQPAAAAPAPPLSLPGTSLGDLMRPRMGRRRRASSWDRSGRNADRLQLAPGETVSIADIRGAGCIRHIWMTIASNEPAYLRRIVLRAYWDGEDEPSVETPVGDFFGVGHGRVSNFWSLPLNMVTGGRPEQENRAAMNCWFPMPFARSARITVQNEGKEQVRALYFYVDYEEYDQLPNDFLRFHAQWRRQYPTPPSVQIVDRSLNFAKVNELVNLDGRGNYVILEAEGRGHYVGCVLSIDHINPIPNFGWFGEGDDMIFIDGEPTPSLVGTGTEDYFCAAWGYPHGHNSMPYHGISLAGPTDDSAAPYSGKWTMYRFHIEDPIMFTRSIKVTIEHGHGNCHANDYSSVAYWYQTEPHAKFPPLPPVEQRLPIPDRESLRQYWKTF